MKTYKYILIILFFIGGTISCDLDEILEEQPKDFLSPENSFTDKAGFESALAHIYLTIRTHMYANSDSRDNFDMLGMGLDLACNRANNTAYTDYFQWNIFNEDKGFVNKWWTRFYAWVYHANVIIGRAEEDGVNWESDEEKNAIVGEAKFLRAFAYHFLANMWGDVPLVLEETAAAKFDYTQVSQLAVYQQCKEDLEFAVQWMPTVDQLPGGRAPRAAAYHLLAEVNISLADYDGAIAAASKVIDDQNYHLMTERFGQWTNFQFNGYDYLGEYEAWGDVYWDLFRENNMNWQEGNREAIWNIEMDLTMIGGGNVGQWGGNFGLERWWHPDWWRQKDKNGVSNWLMDTLSGRPNGGMYVTPYADIQIWEYKDDWDRDIRNSKYNIQRTYYWTNPSSEFYGQPITIDNCGNKGDLYRHISTSFKKGVSAVHHNQFQDSSSGQGHDNGRIYKDWYIMRLAETFLLRAEAYLRKGDKANAAKDINEVRNRAQATPVTDGDVDIDLIMDERARELYMEEFRFNTLTRTGTLVERLMRYNPVVVQNGYALGDHLNKLPIPSAEIEANSEVQLEQNPGY
ncbi:RagB/SusD family nutrient uptake outer membrane protein [Maribellus maritimus]|uniref:RagB/SusD family nutrient uptake outer membrane protein n=1 Tax=Maribellus maritimus TaxID=2870838 RepID=UPI001EEB7C6D|nr:RagB/SusD family nutrient uptake outer membrane protein [Maribellus maritimus]MCG6187592.1 RagB/SusD family nutrient uptake outer membrane protein [Maribellus maritimus]